MRSASNRVAGLPYDVASLQAWLDPLDSLAQVECDGMSRVVSHLLAKNGIEFVVATGLLVDLQRLNDPRVSRAESCGVTHVWVELGHGFIVDYRARMWMGPEAQHGVFIPDDGRFEYRTGNRFYFPAMPEQLLEFVSGVQLSDWPAAPHAIA